MGMSLTKVGINQVRDFKPFQLKEALALQVGNARGKIAESNKSELWNHLSFRSLPYIFEVKSSIFRDNKNSGQKPRKAPLRISKNVMGEFSSS